MARTNINELVLKDYYNQAVVLEIFGKCIEEHIRDNELCSTEDLSIDDKAEIVNEATCRVYDVIYDMIDDDLPDHNDTYRELGRVVFGVIDLDYVAANAVGRAVGVACESKTCQFNANDFVSYV